MSSDSPFLVRRILVVEDEMFAAWALEELLSVLGYKVIGPAARVDKALALVEEETIDAALLDLNLNGENSYPIADALAAREVPFCFSTGYNKDRLANGYRHIPVLQKPYARTKLAEMLTKLLTEKEP